MKLPERGNTAESVSAPGSRQSERDMHADRTDSAPAPPEVEMAAAVADLATRRILRRNASDPSLRCVSSGYMSDDGSCRTTIPTGVVTDVWASQQRAGVRGDRLFHFTWHGELWLAYGLKNGRIRGVYCPRHTAERDGRSASHDPGEEGARANLAVTG